VLIIFTVNDQKVTHDLGQRTLVAGSSGVVKAAFTFDNSWDGLDVVVVFSNSGKKCNNKPIKYDGVPIDIPPEVLIAGKLYVSVIGFGDSGTRKTTQKWDVQQAISGYATKEYVAKADSQLITELFNTLTVTAEKYVGTGNLNTFWGLLKPSIASLNSSVSDVSSRIDLLELFVTNGEIEGNPFSVTFENLTGVSVTGVWNQASSRIEF
jgi:hypothetical protein